MEIRKGIARKIRTSASVTGGGDTQVSTEHIVTCDLDGKVVQVCAPMPPIIEEGDNLAVSGFDKNGIFYGLAYHNQTKGVKGHAGGIPLFVAIIALVITVGVPIGFSFGFASNVNGTDKVFVFVPLMIGFVGVCISGFMLWTALKVRKARTLLGA